MTEQLRWQVGDVSIERVEETITPLPPEVILPGVTDDVLAENPWAHRYFTEDGSLRLSIHSFVVATPDKTVVVDTCVGTAKKRPLPTDASFLERLGRAIPGGLDAVDLVLCTHLHFDHCGWNTRLVDGEYVPTFPNARYLVSSAELQGLEGDEHAATILESSISPIADAGLLDPVASDHELCTEVHLVPTPGHTMGHVSVLIESGGQQALITGDAFHSPIQVARPDIAAVPFDHDSEQSTATRNGLLDRFRDSETLILGTHFAPPTAGHFRQVRDKTTFVGLGTTN